MVIGFGVGAFVGILPGLGRTVAAFMSYGIAKQASPKKEIGCGVIEGIAAAESGNSATVGPTLIPLLAFGIPGSTTAALIGGALTFHGATPSGRMFKLYPAIVYSLFTILILSDFINLGIGRLLGFVYVHLARIPKPLMIPIVILIATIGSYSLNSSIYDVLMMLVLGVVGFILRKLNIPDAPLVITFLISPLAESSLRRALLISGENRIVAPFPSILFVVLFASAVILSMFFVCMQGRKRRVLKAPLGGFPDGKEGDCFEPDKHDHLSGDTATC